LASLIRPKGELVGSAQGIGDDVLVACLAQCRGWFHRVWAKRDHRFTAGEVG